MLDKTAAVSVSSLLSVLFVHVVVRRWHGILEDQALLLTFSVKKNKRFKLKRAVCKKRMPINKDHLWN